MFSLIVLTLTGLSVFFSVLFMPHLPFLRCKVSSYWVLSLLGAAVLLLFGDMPLDYVASALTADGAINPLKILLLFFSMTALSVFLDEVGFFRYLASAALGHAGRHQMRLFCMLYAVVSVLTVFTSNDIVVLTFTPFICLFAKNAGIDPLPYLFAEFVASNTWSMLLIIGNPTNIYLASAAGIDFMTYAATMLLPTLAGGAVSFLILLLIFRRSLAKELTPTEAPAEIGDRVSLGLGVIHLALCTALLAASSYVGAEMYLIALAFAASLLILVLLADLYGHRPLTPIAATFRRLPYALAPFVLSMFVLVLGLRYAGLAEPLAALLFRGEPIFTVGISSFFMANVINNIPMSVLYSSLLAAAPAGSATLGGVYAAVIGSNLGAFFTPVGALAGIMWASILRRLGVRVSFKKFVAYGALISIPTLLVSLGALALVML